MDYVDVCGRLRTGSSYLPRHDHVMRRNIHDGYYLSEGAGDTRADAEGLAYVSENKSQADRRGVSPLGA